MNQTSEPHHRAPLAARLALLDDLRLAEMRALSAQVASVLGHMIGTPLNVIVGRAALLRASPTHDSMIDNARRIEEQAHRLTERVQRLIHYLTLPEPAHDECSVASVVDQAISLYAPIATEHGVLLEAGQNRELQTKVEGVPSLMVLSAVLSLAVRGASQGSALALDVRLDSPVDQVVFSVRVPGMVAPDFSVDGMEPPPKYNLDNAQSERELSVCAAIARRCGGKLDVIERDSGVHVEFYCKQLDSDAA